jgi:outer membrane protein assembly factor BamB
LTQWIFTITILLVFSYFCVREVRARHRILWTFDAKAALTGAPAIGSDGTVFTGSYRPVYALDGVTGNKIWTFNFPSSNEYQASGLVVDSVNTVYTASQVNGKPFRLYALDGATGRIKWITAESPSTPVVGGQRIFLGGTRIAAVNVADGKTLWHFRPPEIRGTDTSIPNNDGAVESIAVAGDTVFAIFGCPYKKLFAVSARTGKPIWSIDMDSTTMFACSVNGSVITDSIGRPVTSDISNNVRAYDPNASGHTVWEFRQPVSAVPAQMVVGPNNVIYFGNSSGMVCAINGDNGKPIWTKNVGEKVWDAPGLSSDGVLYVGTRTNKVIALDSRSGDSLWSISFGWMTRSFPYGDGVSVTVAPDGTVYAASTDGKLYALQSH